MADFPIAGIGSNRRHWPGTIWTFLQRETSQTLENRRAFLLWPYTLIAGSIAYRTMGFEPGLAFIATNFVIAIALGVWLHARQLPISMALLPTLLAAGFALLPLHGALLGGPMLDQARYGTFSARIHAVVFDNIERQRWILSDIVGEPAWAVPDVKYARLSLDNGPKVQLGDIIEGRMRFYPVPPPAVPGGFDSQFVSYFSGIGAYGNALGDIVVTQSAESGLHDRIFALRQAISERAVGLLGYRVGGIAAALIVGDQSRISEEDRELMSSAGLAHILAISGLHLTLVAGTVFTLTRFVMALHHRAAQSYPIKKIAAAFGIATAVAYLVISGMGISAIRSTIMLTLVFAAILCGRQALTMRNVAIAAILIIVVDPASVFRASFQLSFAAVVALIAAYEMSKRGRAKDDAAGRPQKPWPVERLHDSFRVNHGGVPIWIHSRCSA